MAKKHKTTRSVQDILNSGKRKPQIVRPEQLHYKQHISNPVLSKELAEKLKPKPVSLVDGMDKNVNEVNQHTAIAPKAAVQIRKTVPTVVNIDSGQNSDQTATRWIPRYN